jgi:hypothetical protein
VTPEDFFDAVIRPYMDVIASRLANLLGDPVADYQAAAAVSMGQVVCDTWLGHENRLPCPWCGAAL